jgi:hypothetical protein
MRFYPRNSLLVLALSAFAFTATSGWAAVTPAMQMQTTPGTQPGTQQSPPQMGQQSHASRTQSVSGTIVKSGGQYVLQASTGQEYQLSNASRAKAYVGKTVTVTGKVNPSTHSIKVQSIQPE